jgi:hypothetical protein
MPSKSKDKGKACKSREKSRLDLIKENKLNYKEVGAK